MFNLKEIITWLGVTVFELLIFSFSLLIYSVFLMLKLEGFVAANWWFIHAPLFLLDAYLFYFCIIVFIRQNLLGFYRVSLFRAVWSFNQISILFLAKLLLCLKLEGAKHIRYSEIFAPIFFYLLLLMIRGCQFH